jgi:hypothetical protein
MYPDNGLRSPQEPWVAPRDGSVIAVPRLAVGMQQDCSKLEEILEVVNDSIIEQCEAKNEALERIKNEAVVFTVKRKGTEHGELLAKQVIQLVNGITPHPYESAVLISDIEAGDEIFYDFSVKNPDFMSYLIDASHVTFAYIGDRLVRAPFDTTINAKSKLEVLEGHGLPDDEQQPESYGQFMVALVKNDELYLRRIAMITNNVVSGEYNFEENIEVSRDDRFMFEIITPNEWLIDGVHNYAVTKIQSKKADVLLYQADAWSPHGQLNSANRLRFVPDIGFIEGSDSLNGTIEFGVLRNGVQVGTRSVVVVDGAVESPESYAVESAAASNDSFEFRYVTGDFNITSAIDFAGVSIAYGEVVSSGDVEYEDASETHEASVILYDSEVFNAHTEEAAQSAKHHARHEGYFPEPYRGWASIGYNGNSCTVEQGEDEGEWVSEGCAIDESSFDESEQGQYYKDFIDSHGTETGFDEINTSAFPIFAITREKSDGEGTAYEHFWGGSDEYHRVARYGMSSSRLGIDNVKLPRSADFGESPTGGGPATAVPRLSESDSSAHSGGYILSGSTATGDSRSLIDFKDMNGDRYPDVLGGGGIQYTYPTGGLSSQRTSSSIRVSDNESQNIGFGGNPAQIVPGVKGLVTGKQTDGKNNSSMPTLGFGLGRGKSDVKMDLIDVNGDGLPDRVYDNGTVELNVGYGFVSDSVWNFNEIDYSKSSSTSLNLGFNKGIFDFAGGLNIDFNRTTSRKTLLDINGDGLPDLLEQGGGLNVRFNTGHGFAQGVQWPSSISSISRSDSVNAGAGGYITIAVPIPIGITGTKICLIFNPGANVDFNTQRMEMAIQDVNGDGYPDHVQSDENNRMDVALSPIGRTNLLRGVVRPLGGEIEIEYERSGNTYAQPQNRWVMSRVSMDDKYEYGDNPVTEYEYADGYYDRHEREFYGYKTVTESHTVPAAGEERAVYRQFEREYLIGNYYFKGLLSKETILDSGGNRYSETVNAYSLVDALTMEVLEPGSSATNVFPRLLWQIRKRHQPQGLRRRHNRGRRNQGLNLIRVRRRSRGKAHSGQARLNRGQGQGRKRPSLPRGLIRRARQPHGTKLAHWRG